MGHLRTSHADINTGVFFNTMGSNVHNIGCAKGSRLKHVHVEFASAADWAIGTTWVQIGSAVDLNLVPPALFFLAEGTMDPYGGNPSWDGDMPVEQDYAIFIDCIEGVSGGRNLKFIWTWEEP